MTKWTCIFFVLYVFIGCNDSEQPEEKILSQLEISSSLGERLDIRGSSSQLTVSGLDQFGQPAAVIGTISWSSNNDNVSINEDGEVIPLKVGESVVTARSAEVTGSLMLSLWDSEAPRTEIYVSDAGNFQNGPWAIYKYDEQGKNGEIFINNNIAWPQDILFLEDKNEVLISSFSTGNIGRFNSETGSFMGNFATGINQPTRMKIGPDRLIYVLQWSGNGLVLRYDRDGNFIDEFTETRVFQSIGIAWDRNKNLYVSSFNEGSNGSVRKFDPEGKNMGLFISSELQGPTDIWFDSNGDLLANDWTDGVIRRFDGEGNFIDIYTIGLQRPEGIAHFPDGSFLVGNGGTGSVKYFDQNGTFIQDLVPPGASGLQTPNAVILRRVN